MASLKNASIDGWPLLSHLEERPMPGSYTASAVLADSALDTLKRAYEARQSPDVGSLILKAYDAIKNLKDEMSPNDDEDASYDPYELNEANSAI